MKTTEEKARAYDEAIKKAMDLWSSPRTCFDIEQLKSIFPQLAESEDERVRKVIVNLISYGVVPEKEDREKCLTYLERQKEQKPAEWSEEDKTIIEGACNALEIYGHAKLASRLKSLRPSWKPSEEDIKMLEHIIGQYETGNKNSKVMGYLPKVEELNFLKKILAKWKN